MKEQCHENNQAIPLGTAYSGNKLLFGNVFHGTNACFVTVVRRMRVLLLENHAWAP